MLAFRFLHKCEGLGFYRGEPFHRVMLQEYNLRLYKRKGLGKVLSRELSEIFKR